MPACKTDVKPNMMMNMMMMLAIMLCTASCNNCELYLYNQQARRRCIKNCPTKEMIDLDHYYE